MAGNKFIGFQAPPEYFDEEATAKTFWMHKVIGPLGTGQQLLGFCGNCAANNNVAGSETRSVKPVPNFGRCEDGLYGSYEWPYIECIRFDTRILCEYDGSTLPIPSKSNVLGVCLFYEPFCGDSEVDACLGEVCDSCTPGEVCNGQSCATLGLPFTGGILGCSADCTFDTSQCTTCGDGIVNGVEDCEPGDPLNLNGKTCKTLKQVGKMVEYLTVWILVSLILQVVLTTITSVAMVLQAVRQVARSRLSQGTPMASLSYTIQSGWIPLPMANVFVLIKVQILVDRL